MGSQQALAQVRIQPQDFDAAALQAELLSGDPVAGAVASFTGLVRSDPAEPVLTLELEHYPGMTESSISEIIAEAESRWSLLAAIVVHRIGVLQPGEQIVYVGVSSAHRGEAFQACEFIMDYLKTRAPFWKKETTAAGRRWLDARDSDDAAARRW
ncbi:MAG: molybdopterin synthase catalytic subunit MoaE [Halieaceae bacterium]